MSGKFPFDEDDIEGAAAILRGRTQRTCHLPQGHAGECRWGGSGTYPATCQKPIASHDPDANWQNNAIQFARLLAEIKGVGLSALQMRELAETMDLSSDEIHDILERAQDVWDDIQSRT